jgi:hypothetical protein
MESVASAALRARIFDAVAALIPSGYMDDRRS